MTQEEKARELSHKWIGYYRNSDVENVCLEMAKWKQEQVIENMVEWLSLNADLYGSFKPEKLNEMILNIKKTMEE